MSVSMTVCDVPDEVRDELAARAARAGQSLQEYVRGQLTTLAGPLDNDRYGPRTWTTARDGLAAR